MVEFVWRQREQGIHAQRRHGGCPVAFKNSRDTWIAVLGSGHLNRPAEVLVSVGILGIPSWLRPGARHGVSRFGASPRFHRSASGVTVVVDVVKTDTLFRRDLQALFKWERKVAHIAASTA